MNVISEARKRKGERRVKKWLRTRSSAELYLSVLVVGEVRQALARTGIPIFDPFG